MMNKLMKLMEKKGESKLNPLELKAKTSVLDSIRSEAKQKMNGPLQNLKKVTVASDDQEGLKAGLDKAKDLVSNEDELQDLSPEEADESPEEESHEASEEVDPEQMTAEQLDEKIQELQALKQHKLLSQK